MNLKDYLGETNLYDKKEKLELNKPKSWLKSVSAFANGRGGKKPAPFSPKMGRKKRKEGEFRKKVHKFLFDLSLFSKNEIFFS